MSVSVGSGSDGLGGVRLPAPAVSGFGAATREIAGQRGSGQVGDPAQPSDASGTPHGASGPTVVGALPDQPLSPQMLNQLMKLYVSLHGSTT